MYVDCSCGSRHWGHLGAAGLLLTDPDRTGVVLQHRSPRVHQGDTWGVPGGAIDPGEDAVAAALREAHEEAGIEAGAVTVLGTIRGTEHPEWSYTYVLAEASRPSDPVLVGGAMRVEALQTTWINLELVESLDLQPLLRADWPRLHQSLGSAAATF
ncbi:MAG: 8-oxo-dGTP diphosphatase [Nocardioidaceae bacterium]|nr:8-oxo-dGTP diphosphatase [Nocardioidaceae bacterium]